MKCKIAVLFALLATLFLIQSPTALYGDSLSVTWQALPFPVDSDWGGPKGEPAVIGVDEIVLRGQDVRTVESYSAPVSVAFDALLDERLADDGSIDLHFLSAGQSLDTIPNPDVKFRIIYSNNGGSGSVDRLEIDSRDNAGGHVLWTSIPFPVSSQTVYHVEIQLSSAGEFTISINGQNYPVPTDVTVPFSSFQLQLTGWQPTNTWRVRNFTVNSSAPCQLVCGSDVVVQAAAGATSAIVEFSDPVLQGECGDAAIVCVPASGSEFPLGLTEVSCTATDATGIIAQCSFKVTVNGAALCSTLEELIAKVDSLAIESGLRNALTQKLSAAQRSLARSRFQPARNQIHAFINQVSAFRQTEQLEAPVADELIACAQNIMSGIPARRRK